MVLLPASFLLNSPYQRLNTTHRQVLSRNHLHSLRVQSNSAQPMTSSPSSGQSAQRLTSSPSSSQSRNRQWKNENFQDNSFWAQDPVQLNSRRFDWWFLNHMCPSTILIGWTFITHYTIGQLMISTSLICSNYNTRTLFLCCT